MFLDGFEQSNSSTNKFFLLYFPPPQPPQTPIFCISILGEIL